ncbi:MAG TPA: DUF1559 domain-containing protein [Thermoguttaceae bacterium]|nr:DUF1559 domain-containing protein [Thermoguttaceae bacterium]
MPIQFTCPFCGVQTNVADQYAGQTGPCGKCGQQITIPGTPVGPGAYTAAPPRRSSGVGVLVAIIVGVLFMVLICGGILAALLLPAVQAAREAARRAQCTNNLRQIALALQSYHDANGQFPPAYVADAQGKPLYSWRVLILPYLEQLPAYQQFKLDEPWDSPANQAATNMAWSGVFQCPSDSRQDRTKTDYVMVVGPGCISDGPTSGNIARINDGTSNTILVVEVANSDIHWAEPRDLDAKTMSYQINDPNGQSCISSNHHGGANVAFADGSVRYLSDGADPATVRKLIQTNDGAPDPATIP